MLLFNEKNLILSVLGLVSCTTVVSHQGCYVVDPYISGVYQGECLAGKAHGFGKAIGKDIYEGEFFQGDLHGRGVYIWSNGDRYIGQFARGQPNGYGVMRYTHGTERAGIWQNGKLIQPNK